MQLFAATRRKPFQVEVQVGVWGETSALIVKDTCMVGRERGQGQLGFAGELPENGDEEGEGTWRIPWSILRREQWLGRGSIAFAYQNSC